MSTDYERTL